jgi:hypothetical protein
MISEVVCRELLQLGGVFVLDALIVEASASFSASWNATPDMPFPIEPGPYFGTIFRDDVMSGPPTRFATVQDAEHLLRIWVFDSWLCNVDRENEGNLLMVPASNGTVRLIAADQSDCFCGSESFATGNWRERMSTRPPSECPFVAEAIASAGGAPGLRGAIARAVQAFERIEDAFEKVPAEWWARSVIDSRDISEELAQRLVKLPTVLDVDKWGNFDYEQYDGIPIF